MRTLSPDNNLMNLLVFEQHHSGADEPGISRFGILSKYWARQGLRISIIAGMVNYITGAKPPARRFRPLHQERPQKGVTILRAFDSSLIYQTFVGRLYSYFSFNISAFFCGIFFPKADLMIVSSPPIFLGIAAYAISVFRRVPLILEIRDLWPDVAIDLKFINNRLLIKLGYLLEGILYKKTNFIVVNSPGLKKYLIEYKRINERNIDVIPNPLDFDLVATPQPYRDRKRIGWDGKFVILFSGNLSAVYDFDTLLRVAQRLTEHRSFLFVIVGDGRQKQYIKNRIRNEQIVNVLLLPAVSKVEVNRLLSAADICVAVRERLGILKYGYASKLFDYMAAKKPIILLAEGVSADLVSREANCGISLEPGDINGLEKAIIDLFNQPDRRKKYGENGFKFAKKNLRAGHLADRYREIMNKVILSKPMA